MTLESESASSPRSKQKAEGRCCFDFWRPACVWVCRSRISLVRGSSVPSVSSFSRGWRAHTAKLFLWILLEIWIILRIFSSASRPGEFLDFCEALSKKSGFWKGESRDLPKSRTGSRNPFQIQTNPYFLWINVHNPDRQTGNPDRELDSFLDFSSLPNEMMLMHHSWTT